MSHFETDAIRTQIERSQYNEHAAPIYMTSSFVFEDAEDMRAKFADEREGNIYSRFSNPNTSELIEKMCKMEEAEDGFAFATGMAGVFTTMAGLLQSGDHVLACRSVFGSTHNILTKLLPRWNIFHTYLDIRYPDTWEQAVEPHSKVLVVETPSNPGIDLIDLEWVGKFARKHNLILIVDNCFATPYLQKPIPFGTDLVLHSATKYIDGQGRVLGGLVVGRADLVKQIRQFARHSGPALSPMNAWILSKSLETLAVRMDRHSQNAYQIAKWLEDHPEVLYVKYPFLESHPQFEIAKKQMTAGGGVLAFVIKGGLDQGRNFMDSVKMASLTANLGDTRTIVTHPATSTHSKLTDEERDVVGIKPGLIRVSVGLEHADDIIADLDQAIISSKVTVST